MTNFMRPMAIPFAGGVLSAVVLFSMWLVPTYPLRANNAFDIPTMLSTEASIKSAAAVGAANGEIVVDVTVDDQGRMVDYQIVSGQIASAGPKAAAQAGEHAAVHGVHSGDFLWPAHGGKNAAFAPLAQPN